MTPDTNQLAHPLGIWIGLAALMLPVATGGAAWINMRWPRVWPSFAAFAIGAAVTLYFKWALGL